MRSIPRGTSSSSAHRRVRQKSRDAENPSRAPIACSGEVSHGRAFNGARMAARPTDERDRYGISGSRVRMTIRAIPMPSPWYIRSGGTLSPDGAIATTDLARPRRASSSAIRAPRELPSTCTRPTPSASSVRSTASVTAGTVGRPSRCGDLPMQGRSTLSTSKRAHSLGRTAAKARWELPIPCRRRCGSPEPERSTDSGKITGPRYPGWRAAGREPGHAVGGPSGALRRRGHPRRRARHRGAGARAADAWQAMARECPTSRMSCRSSGPSLLTSSPPSGDDVGNDLLTLHRRPDVVVLDLRSGRQLRWLRGKVLVGHLAEQVVEHVEARALLHLGVDHPPRRLGDVRGGEHRVLGTGELDPAVTGLEVHGAELPALGRVLQPGLEAPLLLGVAHGEPVLDQHDPAADEHALEFRARTEELHVLLVGAESHDPFHAGAVVPGPVEQDHLARSGQVGDVALEVPLALLALGRRRERSDSGGTRIERLGDALDRTSLAGGVPALEDHDDPQALRADVLLLLDQLDLQPRELLIVVLDVDLAARPRRLFHRRLGPTGSGHDAEDRPAPRGRQPCPARSMPNSNHPERASGST